ncbi:MAG: HD domain-containing protein [candidate division WOR-3 bacterium]|nr:HD domain-containing protein [candidate division WOR-3 bacterium]MCX7837377.1 HD domain-containing protein [candidate division WOR-3 bacterium]MDW8114008.1 HD domain-containing protein [candidate division WOR-3 bacterium]
MRIKKAKRVNLERLAKDKEVIALINSADKQLEMIGYTEHGLRHARLVAERSYYILKKLGYDERRAELAAITGFLHDIGNVVNRDKHEHMSAILAYQILKRMKMPYYEILEIVSALGNHHEEDGTPISEISAALIIADKSDVHRTRVRNPEFVKFDIHDRVNYAVTRSILTVDNIKKKIIFDLEIDTKIAPVMEYFEIFLNRMIMARRASHFLGCEFELYINQTKLI